MTINSSNALQVDHNQKELQRMHLNENLVFPKNVMRRILAKCADEFDPRVYPPSIFEGESLLLNRELARYCGCSEKSVMIGAGGDQLIDLVFRMTVPKSSDVVVIVSPTFPMYPFFAKSQGFLLQDVWLNPSAAKEPFSLPSNVKEIWKRSRAKLLVIVSPNNPTGIQFPIEEITELLEAVPDKPVLLDEAYVEYAKYDGAKKLLKSHPNLVVLRTFSKAFALASLRLGYILCSNSEFIQKFNETIQYPYPVTGLSISMGLELLRRRDAVLEWVEKTKLFREELIASLQKLPKIRVVPRSDTNFVLVQAGGAKKLSDELLTQYSILVKHFPSLGKEKDFLRITVGSQEANRRLLFALKRILL
ncbi:MAG TPA: histidinol-phosphate transaminase [Nitrososphaerales archaeon]|nr:histidinol-phosphate transaminase [Nitrososphaerales archaeon]